MKPVVDLGRAWCCTIFSLLCILILGVFALLFHAENHELVGHDDDTASGKVTARAIFVAILVYGAFVILCLFQVFLHSRQPRSISLR